MYNNSCWIILTIIIVFDDVGSGTAELRPVARLIRDTSSGTVLSLVWWGFPEYNINILGNPILDTRISVFCPPSFVPYAHHGTTLEI